MKNQEDTRRAVAEAYAKAVSAPVAESCCAVPVQKGEVVKVAGYSPKELEALPGDAVMNSFGCGNPLAFSGVVVGDTVLDLGSGAGIDLLIAAKKTGPSGKVIGVDMTDEMIAKARQNIADSGFDNIEVRKGIIEELPIESESVDWVISNCVINLSPDKSCVFREISRVLKPGGRMSVSDIVAEKLPDWIRNERALYSCCVAGALSEQSYLDGLRDAGLVDVRISERIVYDESQLGSLFKSDVTEDVACCLTSADEDSFKRAAKELAGSIWSAKIVARKPTSN